jgi:hypothetical protein
MIQSNQGWWDLEYRTRRFLIAACAAIFVFSGAEEGFAFLDARVLPKGRTRFSVIGAQTGSIQETFDSEGRKVSLTAPYNFQLNAENLQTFSQELKQLIQILNSTGLRYDASARATPTYGITTDTKHPLLGDAVNKGNLEVAAEAVRTQYNFQFQHGLSDQLSVGFMLPLIKSQVTVSNGIRGIGSISDLAAGMQAYAGTPGVAEAVAGLQSLNAVNTETLQQLLQDRGYSRFQSTAQDGIGDLVFGGRYNYLRTKKDELIHSVQLGITAPTGATRPPAELTSIDRGQGAWDAGAAHITNYTPWRLLSFSHSLHYTHRLPSSRVIRVRNDPSDAIPDSSSEERTRMLLGDKIWTTLGARVNLTRALNFIGGYEWYWKQQDRYLGSRPKDYSYLSENTQLYSETLNLGINFSTIPAFLDYVFPLPLDLSLNYFLPTRGRNAIIASYVTLELALYF